MLFKGHFLETIEICVENNGQTSCCVGDKFTTSIAIFTRKVT